MRISRADVASRTAGLAVMAALAGCAARGGGGDAGAAPETAAAAAPAAAVADSAGPPVVQIRDFPRAAVVTVVAWSPGDADYGLRAHVNQRGELVGTQRLGDHRLYVSATRAEILGGFTRAWVVPVPPGPVLLHGRPVVDPQACNQSDSCAPGTIIEVQMPDDLLRQHRDSMVVTFSGGRFQDWAVTLHGAVIDAYLRAVDSVAAARRAP